jgi:hypothetical protein
VSETMETYSIPSILNVERLGEAIVEAQRKELSDAIAALDEELSQVQVYDEIKRFEDEMVEAMDEEGIENREETIRLYTHQRIVDRIAEE